MRDNFRTLPSIHMIFFGFVVGVNCILRLGNVLNLYVRSVVRIWSIYWFVIPFFLYFHSFFINQIKSSFSTYIFDKSWGQSRIRILVEMRKKMSCDICTHSSCSNVLNLIKVKSMKKFQLDPVG